MEEFEFELIYNIGQDLDPDECVELLHENGCDDALIGTGKIGEIAVMFKREHESALDALNSGIKDTKKVLPEAELVEIKSNDNSASEIAKIIQEAKLEQK